MNAIPTDVTTRLSPVCELVSQGFDSPGRTATSKKIAVAGEDASIQRESERDWWPIVGIARDTTPCSALHRLVDISRNNFDRMVIE